MPNTDLSSFSSHLLLLIFVIHDSKLNILGVLGGKCHFGLREISSFYKKPNQTKTKTFYWINNQDYLIIIIIIPNCSPAVLTPFSLPLSGVAFTASSISLTRLYNTQTFLHFCKIFQGPTECCRHAVIKQIILASQWVCWVTQMAIGHLYSYSSCLAAMLGTGRVK